MRSFSVQQVQLFCQTKKSQKSKKSAGAVMLPNKSENTAEMQFCCQTENLKSQLAI